MDTQVKGSGMKPVEVFLSIDRAVIPLTGFATEGFYNGEGLWVKRGVLEETLDLFQNQAIVQDKAYIRWSAAGREQMLFEHGVFLEKRYSGRWTNVREDLVHQILMGFLEDLKEEQERVFPVKTYYESKKGLSRELL